MKDKDFYFTMGSMFACCVLGYMRNPSWYPPVLIAMLVIAILVKEYNDRSE